jgi:hypothetical protein
MLFGAKKQKREGTRMSKNMATEDAILVFNDGEVEPFAPIQLEGKGEQSFFVEDSPVLNAGLRIGVMQFNAVEAEGDVSQGIPDGDFVFAGYSKVFIAGRNVLREGDESAPVTVTWPNNPPQVPSRQASVVCKIQSAGQSSVIVGRQKQLPPEPPPEVGVQLPQSVQVRGQDIVFEKQNETFAYYWDYESSPNITHRILLQHDSWDIARAAGWSIEDVLNGAQPIVWDFLRAFCNRFPDVKRIDITSVTRPGDANTDSHAAGYSIDVGALSFTNALLNFQYKRAFINSDGTDIPSLEVPEPNERYRRVREWIWGESGYIMQYIDPWQINYGSAWMPNMLASRTEIEHYHHLHLTFRGFVRR